MGAFAADLAALRRQRQFWHELDTPPRRALLLTRVRVEDLSARQDNKGVLELMKRHVIGWRGFTMADILGPGIGSSDPIDDWDEEFFRDWVADFPEILLDGCWPAQLEKLNALQGAKEAAAKN